MNTLISFVGVNLESYQKNLESSNWNLPHILGTN